MECTSIFGILFCSGPVQSLIIDLFSYFLLYSLNHHYDSWKIFKHPSKSCPIAFQYPVISMFWCLVSFETKVSSAHMLNSVLWILGHGSTIDRRGVLCWCVNFLGFAFVLGLILCDV